MNKKAGHSCIYLSSARKYLPLWLENMNFEGSPIGETKHNISQYADDIKIRWEVTRIHLKETVKTITTFGNKLSLFLNKREV